jgi:hypothetical protein
VLAFDWRSLLVTLLVAVVAVCLVWPQIFPSPDQMDQMNLPNLDKREAMLRQISDPIERDKMCIGLSAFGRQLDAAVPPHARIYLTGMLGPTNQGGLGYYYFLRNYLFPRDLEIYLGQGSFTRNGFTGQAADSPEMLKTNGFDLVLVFENNQVQLLPLTTNGVPKPQ